MAILAGATGKSQRFVSMPAPTASLTTRPITELDTPQGPTDTKSF